MTEDFNKHVIHLTPDDFDEIESWKLNRHGCSFVMFHVDWCGYCQQTKPVWNKLAEITAFFDVAEFDCEKYKSHLNKIKDDVPDMIKSYPTLVVYSKGEPVYVYKGERELDLLLDACMNACKIKK